MSDATTTSTMVDQPDDKSGLWLALRVFDEPGQVFQQLARRPRVLVPILLVFVVTGITSFLIPASVLRGQAQQQMEMVERMAPGRVTAEARDAALAKAASPVARIQTFAAISIGIVVILVITTLVFWAIFSLGGGEVKFKDEFAIMTHSYMPQLLGYAVVVGLSPLTQDLQFNLGLGFLFEPDTFLKRLSAFCSVFSIWQIYLLALGNQIKTKAKGIGGPLMTVSVVWLIAALAGAGLGGLVPGMMR